jgi:hypothetical protein
MVEFWREEDARRAEDEMHCADVDGQNIAVQWYQPRRASVNMSEFSPNAPTFVPTGSVFPYPTTPTQVCRFSLFVFSGLLLKKSEKVLPAAFHVSYRACKFRAWPWPTSSASSTEWTGVK